jgi:hypothetical protein
LEFRDARPLQFSERSSHFHETLSCITRILEQGDVMERRHFLRLAFGFAAGAAALAASAQAAPLVPQPLTDGRLPPGGEEPGPAVTTENEVDRLKPEEVRWGRRRWGWRRRHWGWRRRHWGWRRRHWGYRRRWHRRRFWRRRYW